MSNLSLLAVVKPVTRAIPHKIIQKALDYALEKMFTKYPRIFQKVAEEGDFSYLIRPTDLPFNFYLVMSANAPVLTLEPKTYEPQASATITATLANLLSMLEGRLDGDAAFFSKTLVVEGSTVAIVSLRNAIESENINTLEDLTSDLKLIGPWAKKGIGYLIKKYQSLEQDLNDITQQALAESILQNRINSAEIAELREQIKTNKGH